MANKETKIPHPAKNGDPVIEIRDLYKRLDSRVVLDGVNLTILRGETFAIIGGSGAGKSVTLKNMVGLMCPDRGEIRILGQSLCPVNRKALAAVRKRIGFLFQGAALLGSMNVFDNVALPLKEHDHISPDELKTRVLDTLALVGLKDAENKMPAILSGGMRKRVGLARAIIRRPEIIFYDEPTAGLDPVIASTINELILDMQKKLDITSVLVTHDMSSVFTVANRIGMLYKGRIIKIGTQEEFKASEDSMVRQFIYGHSEGPLRED